MPSLDSQALSFAVRLPNGVKALKRKGISAEHFDEKYQPMWNYLNRCIDKHGKIPSVELLESKFRIRFQNMSKEDLGPLADALADRKRYEDFLAFLESAARNVEPENIDDAIKRAQGKLDKINGIRTNGHVHDPFSRAAVKRMLKEVQGRKEQKNMRTGLRTLDQATGGLRAGELVIVAGRPNTGKSYFAIWVLAHALRQRRRSLMYSLEMPEAEVFARLYTVATRLELGPQESLRNMDFHTGELNLKHYLRAMKAVRRQYKGLFNLSDFSVSCTLEQIDMDIQNYGPEIVWIDYLTLMPKPRSRNGDGWEAIRELSGGLKMLAVKHGIVVGACAQLNRLAEGKTDPGLGTLAYSDSVGQDADLVITLAEGKNRLMMQIPKNRHGPKVTEPVPLLFAPDEGWIEELKEFD